MVYTGIVEPAKRERTCVHQRHSMILGKSGKIRTFTGLDTPRLMTCPDIGYSVPRKKFDSGKIRILILDVYAACAKPDTSPYFRFSKEYGFVSTNIEAVTRLISRVARENYPTGERQYAAGRDKRGNFRSRSCFARSTIPEEKLGLLVVYPRHFAPR